MTYLDKARARLQGSRLAQDVAGLSTVEYVIILVLVAAIAIGTWQTFGQAVVTGLNGATQTFNTGVVNQVPAGTGTGQGNP